MCPARLQPQGPCHGPPAPHGIQDKWGGGAPSSRSCSDQQAKAWHLFWSHCEWSRGVPCVLFMCTPPRAMAKVKLNGINGRMDEKCVCVLSSSPGRNLLLVLVPRIPPRPSLLPTCLPVPPPTPGSRASPLALRRLVLTAPCPPQAFILSSDHLLLLAGQGRMQPPPHGWGPPGPPPPSREFRGHWLFLLLSHPRLWPGRWLLSSRQKLGRDPVQASPTKCLHPAKGRAGGGAMTNQPKEAGRVGEGWPTGIREGWGAPPFWPCSARGEVSRQAPIPAALPGLR